MCSIVIRGRKVVESIFEYGLRTSLICRSATICAQGRKHWQ